MRLSEFLAEFPDVDATAGADLAAIAGRAFALDRKGSLTVQLKVEKKGGRVMVTVGHEAKPPKDDPEAGLYFVADQGLSKDDPWQARIEFDPATGEVTTHHDTEE